MGRKYTRSLGIRRGPVPRQRRSWENGPRLPEAGTRNPNWRHFSTRDGPPGRDFCTDAGRPGGLDGVGGLTAGSNKHRATAARHISASACPVSGASRHRVAKRARWFGQFVAGWGRRAPGTAIL